MRRVDETRYTRFLDHFCNHYNAEMVLRKYGLLQDAVELSDQYSLCCPFHDDILPSFRISKETGVWHCFGCGIGDHLFGLMYRLDNTSVPLPIYADNYLKQDTILQRELGFKTIFMENTKMTLSEFVEQRKRSRFTQSASFDMPISILAKQLKERDNSFAALSSSLEMLQAGASCRNVFHLLGSLNRVEQTTSLSDLLD